jgi:hypothetical protein
VQHVLDGHLRVHRLCTLSGKALGEIRSGKFEYTARGEVGRSCRIESGRERSMPLARLGREHLWLWEALGIATSDPSSA